MTDDAAGEIARAFHRIAGALETIADNMTLAKVGCALDGLKDIKNAKASTADEEFTDETGQTWRRV